MKKALILLAIFAVSAMAQNPVTKGFSRTKTLTTFWSPLPFQYGKNSTKDFTVVSIGSDTVKVAFNVYDTTTAPSVYSHIRLFGTALSTAMYSAQTIVDTLWVKGSTTSAIIFINATYSK